jgi:hypothetical protein
MADLRQISHLGMRAAVIERGVILTLILSYFGLIPFVQNCGHVDTLWPTAAVSLVQQDVIGDTDTLGTPIELRRLV